jgi:uncharacterized repeat protein (TIGR01451 family)
MMRISTFKTVLRRQLLISLLLAALPFASKADDVGITIQANQVQAGETVQAEFLVYDFTDILSFQFSIQWDPGKLEFQAVQPVSLTLPGLTAANFGVANTANGALTVSWFDPQLDGETLSNCAAVFSVIFQSIDGSVPVFQIAGSPTPIEVVGSGGQQLNLAQDFGCGDAGIISGNIFHDSDCLPGPGETKLSGWKIKAEGNGNTIYGTTNFNGDFSFYALSGTYEVSVILPGTGLWTACMPSQSVTVATGETSVADFPMLALFDCPQLNVDISAPFLRRCFNSKYYINYCNQGTLTAEDAYVEITFDPFLEVTGSSIPWSASNGQTYTFDLGDMGVGECGSFTVDVAVSCDAVLGQTHCSSAHIYPDSLCIPVSSLWDGSDLEVTGLCDGDSVRFTIINTGEDMAEPVEFIVIEDDMIQLTSDPVLLYSQQSVSIAFPANGSTWRLEAGETPNNPFGTLAAAAVEGCGTNGSGSFSLGFVTQFPPGDEAPFLDEDCLENIGSFDPNDKTGYPKGFCASRFVKADQDIDYLIRFQNTGTDTAFTVIIQDTLSAFLNVETVLPGTASHAYDFELLGNGVVQFTFENIMLPDSNVNEAASHGFVKFRVSQKTGNPAGTLLENQAAIYFDFNEPVITNQYRHTVGNNFVEMSGGDGDLEITGKVTTMTGQPLNAVEMQLTDNCPVYTDANGNFVFQGIDTASYVLSAYKENINRKDGLTILDIVKIRNAILTVKPLDNALQVTAADVNKSFSVTTFDMVMIARTILEEPVTGDFFDWRFITSGFDPGNPFQLPPPVYTYSPLEMNQSGQDFTAIKPGDVIHESMVEISPTNTQFYFENAGMNGNKLKINVKAKDYQAVYGFQFGLNWDPAVLTFLQFEAGALNGFGTWSNSPSSGQLQFIYLNSSPEDQTVADGETLFTMVFNTTGQIGTSTQLSLDQSKIPFQVVVDTCKLTIGSVAETEVVIGNTTSVDHLETDGFTLKIAPNPVRSGQPVFFETTSETARHLTLQIFDTSGILKMKSNENIPADCSRFSIAPQLAEGLYLLSVSDENGLERTLKLVVF